MLIRGGSSNPSSLKFAALMNKQNIAENEIFKPERSEPRILSRAADELVLVQDPLSFQQLRYINNLNYFGPFEPDGVKLKYWCKFNNISSDVFDHSFSKNHSIPVGNPKLCKGPSDGVKGGTIVTRINSDPTSIDYFYTRDADDIRVSDITVTGFSEYIEFMIESIPAGLNSMVQFKVDDEDGLNGVMLKVGPNGELKWFVRKAGVTRNFISANNKITVGRWNAICLTYTLSGNIMAMRINNEVQVDSANETPVFPLDHDTSLFHGIGADQTDERFVGRLKDSRWYDSFVFSSTQMDNIWNNKRSISPTAYGHLSVAGPAHFNSNVYTGSYDVIAYDGTGFETI